jgi:caa(3)-type oxidase subunit IV
MASHSHSHGHAPTAHDNPAEHVDNPATIFMVYLVLVAGSILTIACSMSGLGDKAIYAHMLISTVQVCFVGYYWMHLRRADSLTWLIALSAFFFMLILFALPLADILTRENGGL